MREFLWVQDMAEACLFLIDHYNFSDCTSENNEIRNTHMNIGTGVDITIANLANMLKECIQFKGDFVFNSNKPDGTMRKVTDVTKINELGWKAKVSLEEGIKQMYQWYITK